MRCVCRTGWRHGNGLDAPLPEEIRHDTNVQTRLTSALASLWHVDYKNHRLPTDSHVSFSCLLTYVSWHNIWSYPHYRIHCLTSGIRSSARDISLLLPSTPSMCVNVAACLAQFSAGTRFYVVCNLRQRDCVSCFGLFVCLFFDSFVARITEENYRLVCIKFLAGVGFVTRNSALAFGVFCVSGFFKKLVRVLEYCLLLVQLC